jgi:hypothetical protein
MATGDMPMARHGTQDQARAFMDITVLHGTF